MKEGELGRLYADREVIFSEGDKGDTMYVIQSGKVKISKKTASKEIVIAEIGSGEILGEMALFDRLPRSATATALGETRILSIDKKKLFATISRDPTLVFKILESMSRRIRRLNENIAGLRKQEAMTAGLCLDMDATCRLILDEAKHLVRSDQGSVMLFDEKDKSLCIKAAFGVETAHKLKLGFGEGIAGDVMKSGKAELINHVRQDSRFVPGEVGISSMLCVPLRCQERTFGVINISNSSEQLFTLDDLKLLHSLAIYASLAIQNAWNLSSLKDATSEVLRHATLLDM
jgi:CRP-like cAMP-binding protein